MSPQVLPAGGRWYCMVVDPDEAVPLEDDEEEASGWRAKLKRYYRKLFSQARY